MPTDSSNETEYVFELVSGYIVRHVRNKVNVNNINIFWFERNFMVCQKKKKREVSRVGLVVLLEVFYVRLQRFSRN